MKHDMICEPMKKRTKTLRILKAELGSRIEIQQRSLQAYSREIFENIGQVLSLVKFQLSSLDSEETTAKKKAAESGKLLGKAISDLRNLTKQLTPDEIIKKGFASSIHYELKRLSEAEFCKINFKIKGKPINLDEVKELVVFCILQQLTYPVLDIHAPGTIDMQIHYKNGQIEVEIIREFNKELLLLNNEELEKLNQRLETINSSVQYKSGEKRILQITINF
jgi:signal transduction histidine kinase